MIIAGEMGLPRNFRPADVLAFHGRDRSGLAEVVAVDRLRKGLIWNGQPACLSLRFAGRRAFAELAVDGRLSDDDGEAVWAWLGRMLGLMQPIELFEETYRSHPQVGHLIAQNPGLRLPAAASLFEALTWAVTGQQISVAAAISLRRGLIQAVGVRHSQGLYCYPDAAGILRLERDELCRIGFSRTKSATLLEISRRVVDGKLPFEQWLKATSMADISEQLLAIPGVGPWTVNYALLRGAGWLDGSLHGDAAARRKLGLLLCSPETPDEKEAERWLAPFSPWRALVAAHLWAWESAAVA